MARLAMMEELKTMPVGDIGDNHCQSQNVAVGPAWIEEIKSHERDVLAKQN